jgi:Family of unknown function (DUF6502)
LYLAYYQRPLIVFKIPSVLANWRYGVFSHIAILFDLTSQIRPPKLQVDPELSAHSQRKQWVLDMCHRLLRPVVRLALVYGVKHTEMADLLRRLMIDEARELWADRGVALPNVSQLSITSGVNRKQVTVQIRTKGELLSVTETSLASRVFTHWAHLAYSRSDYASLPFAATSQAFSFESMVRKLISSEVHHKTIAEELLRLGLAQESDGTITLIKDAFVPSEDERVLLAFAADNGADHLMAATSNLAGRNTPLLERAVFADGLAIDGAQRIERFTRQQWAVLHDELVTHMQNEVDQVQGKGGHRIRVGVYVYHEPVSIDNEKVPNV